MQPQPATMEEASTKDKVLSNVEVGEELGPSSGEHTDIGPLSKRPRVKDANDLPDFEELPDEVAVEFEKGKDAVLFEEGKDAALKAEPEAELGAVPEAVFEEEAEAEAGEDTDGFHKEERDITDQGWVLKVRFRKSGKQAGHRILSFIGPDGARFASKAKALEGGLPADLFAGHL